MKQIKRVPKEVSGVSDGVQTDLKCVYTRFLSEKMRQKILDCSVLTSWENGIISFNYTLNGQRQSIGIRLDELMEILKEATKARIEASESQNKCEKSEK